MTAARTGSAAERGFDLGNGCSTDVTAEQFNMLMQVLKRLGWESVMLDNNNSIMKVLLNRHVLHEGVGSLVFATTNDWQHVWQVSILHGRCHAHAK